MNFLENVQSNFLSIAQALVLGSVGFYVLRRGIMGQCCLRTISNLVLEVTLPCFMFTNIIMNFYLVRGEGWYLFPVYALVMIVASFSVSAVFAKIDGKIISKREFVSLVSFQNGGFIPIIIIGAMMPPETAGKMYVYIFLFTIVFPPVMFTMGDKIFGGGAGLMPAPKSFLNAATVATVAAVAISLLGVGRFIPDLVFRPVRMIGDSTIPLSMIVVGGIMVQHFSDNQRFQAGFVIKAGALKLLAIPAMTLAFLYFVNLPRDVEFFLFLESLMPPATTLPLLAQKHKGDYLLVGQGLFGITLAAMFTMPLLMGIFNAIMNGNHGR